LAKWWDYVTIAPDPKDPRPSPPRAEWIIRPTPGGRLALDAWRPLSATIERRWEERFGTTRVGALRESLAALANRIDADFPAYLPILGYDLTATGMHRVRYDPDGARTDSLAADGAGSDAGIRTDRDLSASLTAVLFAFTLDFEREAQFALAAGANALRVVSESGVRLADLPFLCGLSKPAIDFSLKFLERKGLAVLGSAPPPARAKIVRLTAQGRLAQERYYRCLELIEQRWESRFGAPAVRRLRSAASGIRDARDADGPLLSRGLRPHPGGWRAHPAYAKQTRAIVDNPHAALPRYPMVLHRGGWPDGS
jgi:DNA-binding MarR family transcriptional regulator